MDINNLTYPLSENASDSLTAASGKPLSQVTADAVRAGGLSMADVQINAETLRAQAEVAKQAGYPQQALNLIRAAELTAVPNDEILRMYNALRPGRAGLDRLTALAKVLEEKYRAPECARMVREAAQVYEARGLLEK